MDHTEDLNEDALHFALSLAARIALSHDDPEAFLDWLRQHGLKFFIEAGMVPDVPQSGWPAIGTVLGRALWNHLPRPDNDFRPRKLPEPGRNDPCPCGSGRKYKHCCGGVGQPPLDFSDELLLPYVLGLLAKKDLRAIPHRRFSPELLADIARHWQDKGEADRGRLLLEPLFADPRPLDARHAAAFDALMDIYLDLDKPRKRKALLEAGLAAADPVLRGTARQRQALMLMDGGDRTGAWAAFQAAQRDNPDDPNLAALELSLLQGEDKPAQLQERARFWAAKLRRRPDAAELADMIALLEDAAADPDSFAEQFMGHALPGLAELGALLAQMPPIMHPPRIEVLEDGRGVIEDSLPETVFEAWSAVFDEAEAEGVHAWLRAHPEAWDSLDVLDDLASLLVDEIEPTSWMDRHISPPLFERVRALADAALAALPVPPARLEWGFLENRAWHRLLSRRAHWLAGQGRAEEAIREAEALLAWNPNDNLGMRDFLGAGYARAGRHAELLALTERYPEDLAAMRYNRALALFALGRKGEALAALTEAARHYPKLLKTLLAEHPGPAKPDRFGVQVGGDYEAWLYREAVREAWRRYGALDWARECAPALKLPR